MDTTLKTMTIDITVAFHIPDVTFPLLNNLEKFILYFQINQRTNYYVYKLFVVGESKRQDINEALLNKEKFKKSIIPNFLI